jgi:hypothetical protein
MCRKRLSRYGQNRLKGCAHGHEPKDCAAAKGDVEGRGHVEYGGCC